MSDFVTLTCPSCGGKLQVLSDMDLFACAYCGTELRVRRGGGAVSLAPVVAKLDEVRVGVDKTTSELAIARLRSEISSMEAEIRGLVEWSRRAYPDNRLLQRSVAVDVFLKVVEDDLRSRKTALRRAKSGFPLFRRQQAEAAKARDLEILERSLARLTSLVTTLRDKESQLERHEQIVG